MSVHLDSSDARSPGKASASDSRFGQMFGALRQRLWRKLVAVAPVLVGALLLLGVISALAYVLEPYLPTTFRHLIGRVTEAGWAGSCANMTQILGGDTQPHLFVGLHLLQVIVVPIPGQLLGLLGGCLFGFWDGLLLTMLGLTLGSGLAMAGSRLIGDAVVRRFVSPAILARFDRLTAADGVWGYFVIFLLPTFPDDAICFMAGLTRLPIRRLLLVCMLGRLPGMAVLTLVGTGSGGIQTNLALAMATLIAVGLWLFSEEVEGMLGRVVAS